LPACAVVGVQLKVPAVLLAFVTKAAPEGSGPAAKEVIGFPSGSEAKTVNVIGFPATPEAVAGAVTTGARSTSVIVIWVLAAPLSAFVAVKVTP
jgi:hypothetical protein